MTDETNNLRRGALRTDKAEQAARASRRPRSYVRSAETHRAILEAAVSCLVRDGHHAMTMQRIAAEAGVTRGCVQYYAASLDALLIAVQEYIVERVWGDYLAQVRALPAGPDRLAQAMDMAFALPSSPYFIAWSELLAASRTLAQFRPAVERGARLLEDIHDELLREVHGTATPDQVARIRVMDDLVVMGLHAVPLMHFSGDSAQRKQDALALLRQQAQALFAPHND